jgi:hypothetical protein
VKPSNATIDFSFIYNSCGVRAEDRVQRLVRTLVLACCTPHPAAKGSNQPFIGEP